MHRPHLWAVWPLPRNAFFGGVYVMARALRKSKVSAKNPRWHYKQTAFCRVGGQSAELHSFGLLSPKRAPTPPIPPLHRQRPRQGDPVWLLFFWSQFLWLRMQGLSVCLAPPPVTIVFPHPSYS